MKNSRKSLGVIGKFVVGAIVLALVLLYLLVTPLKSNVNRIIMLFTSKSVESMMGYIKSFGNYSAGASILLFIFQGITVVFNEALVFLANIKMYGNIVGGAVSYIGLLLGVIICFVVTRSLLNHLYCNVCSKNKNFNKFNEVIENNGFLVVLFLRFVPFLPIGFVSLLSGLLPIKFRDYFAASLIGIMPQVIIYSIVGKRLTQSQENVYNLVLIVLALAVCTVCFVKIRKTIKK